MLVFTIRKTACYHFFQIFLIIIIHKELNVEMWRIFTQLYDVFSAADWRYAAQQFLDRLPDKVIVHCECISFIHLPLSQFLFDCFSFRNCPLFPNFFHSFQLLQQFHFRFYIIKSYNLYNIFINTSHAGSECNCSTLTFDGVDRMGERLAEEVFFSLSF